MWYDEIKEKNKKEGIKEIKMPKTKNAPPLLSKINPFSVTLPVGETYSFKDLISEGIVRLNIPSGTNIQCSDCSPNGSSFYSLLKEINVEPGNQTCASDNGILYSSDKKILYACPAAYDKNVVIPDTVETIGERAFKGCRFIKEVVIPDSVKTIGSQAFADCKALNKVVMSDNITSFGKEVFLRCSKIISAGPKNTAVEKFNFEFSWTEKIPEDASIIVFMSPERDLTDRMYNMMYDWLTNNDGGDAIFVFDPLLNGGKLTNFTRLLSELFGLQVNNDIVTDVTGNQLASAGKDSYIYASSVEEEEGPLADFTSSTKFYAFDSCSIKVLAPVGEFDAGKLIETRGTESVCTDILTGEKTHGKATLAAYSQRLNSNNRVAVFGSSQLLKDEVINKYANTNTVGTFIYSAFWMEDMFESAAEDIEAQTNAGGAVSVSGTTSRWLAAFAIVIYPCLIILFGIVIWLRRRHL